MTAKPPIRGIVICVNYDDLLEITLWKNMRHLTECLVVTSPNDVKTKALCTKVPGVKVYETDAFYRYGAKFNKGLAMEEGFEQLGREGWILIWDADTLLPNNFNLPSLQEGNLYGVRRRICNPPSLYSESYDWSHAPISNDRAFPGYFQLFHASDPTIAQLPWYDVTFAHAGGGDGYFESRWRPENKIRILSFDVLHLGPRDANWFGRASERVDGEITPEQSQNRIEMMRYLSFKGWAKTPYDVRDYNEKVEVPGASPTGYRLKGRLDK